MKIESCIVRIRTAKGLHRVETVCFKNAITWGNDSKTHLDFEDHNIRQLHIDRSNDRITYMGSEEDGYPQLPHYNVTKFINKFDKTEKPKHRIKTEEEFIDEFGKDWKSKVCWNSQGKMDYLFGHKFTKNEEDINLSRGTSLHIDEWSIFNKMVIEIDEKKPKIKQKNIESKPKYRIKTEKEFIEEFGEDWRHETDDDCGFVDSMDFLLEKELTEGEEKKYLASPTEFNSDVGNWSISKDMITEIKPKIKTKNIKFKPKYRIKNKQEFIKGFGVDWRNKTSSYFSIDMYYLFDKKLTEYEKDKCLAGELHIDGWGISKDMIIEIKENKPIVSRLIDKFITVPKVTLNDSLYRHRKVNLNQND